jgi:hypothetical protein
MFISGKAIKSVIASTNAIAILFGTGLMASAQTYSSGQTAMTGASYASTSFVRRFNGSQKASYKAVDLKDPVSAPFIPAYVGQGAKYNGGVYYPYLKGRQCYVMNYLAKDSARDVIRNYRNSLAQNGWQIDALQSGVNGLTAIRKDNGLCFSLRANQSSVAGFKSSFEIKYLTAGSVQFR